jgi:hypothetical protein
MYVKGAFDSTSEHYAALKDDGDYDTYTITMADVDNLSPLRITLAYTDFCGSTGTVSTLYNDLDIELYNATHSFYPLITNSDGKYDRKNPLELIVVENPKRGGVYTLKVSAYSISVSPQPYALVITGEVGQYNYDETEVVVTSGLTQKAKIAIAVMTILACILISCVLFIGSFNAKRKAEAVAERNLERQRIAEMTAATIVKKTGDSKAIDSSSGERKRDSNASTTSSVEKKRDSRSSDSSPVTEKKRREKHSEHKSDDERRKEKRERKKRHEQNLDSNESNNLSQV